MTYVVARFTPAFFAMSWTLAGPSSSIARYTLDSLSDMPSSMSLDLRSFIWACSL